MSNSNVLKISESARQTYVQRRVSDLSLCEQALTLGDWATLERIAHRFKGSGTTFGFPELTLIGARLEASANAADVQACKHQVAEFSAWIGSLRR